MRSPFNLRLVSHERLRVRHHSLAVAAPTSAARLGSYPSSTVVPQDDDDCENERRPEALSEQLIHVSTYAAGTGGQDTYPGNGI